MYDKLNLEDNAAAAYTEFCTKEEEQQSPAYEDQNEYYNSLRYLANYHLRKGDLEEAHMYANKCLERDEVIFINNDSAGHLY